MLCRPQEIDICAASVKKLSLWHAMAPKTCQLARILGRPKQTGCYQDDPAAEGNGPLLHARAGMLRALNHGAERGSTPIAKRRIGASGSCNGMSDASTCDSAETNSRPIP
jgi:hypothetical protein